MFCSLSEGREEVFGVFVPAFKVGIIIDIKPFSPPYFLS